METDIALAGATALTIAEGGDELSQYLTFRLGEDLFAVGILEVREIIEVGTVSPVPMTPDYIRGVLNLRGAVLPVLDLANRLGRTLSDVSKRSCIVVVDVETGERRQTLGMLVDEVNEVLEIPNEQMQAAPEFGTDIRTDFIRHMARLEDRFVIVLNVDRVLSIEELAQLQGIAETGDNSG